MADFYVQRPINAYWLLSLPNYVVEAAPLQLEDEEAVEKTNEFVQEHLKVIAPRDLYPGNVINKALWSKCLGPSRYIKCFEEYVSLYCSNVDPLATPPIGWNVRRISNNKVIVARNEA